MPDLLADEEDLMAADLAADDLMMADDLMAPPPHVFRWLSRTNRQAKCFACQKMIPGQSYRAIYEPDKAAVKNPPSSCGLAWLILASIGLAGVRWAFLTGLSRRG